MKLHIASSLSRKKIVHRPPQWVYQQDMYRLSQQAPLFDGGIWKKFRNITMQEAHWVILLGIISMLVGGMFILLWSFIAIDSLNV